MMRTLLMAAVAALVPCMALAQNTVELQTEPPTPMPSVTAPGAVIAPPSAQPPRMNTSPLANATPPQGGPPMNVPAVTLPGQAAPDPAAPGGEAQQPKKDPNLEFVAVEAVKNGQKTELSEGLKPFAAILKKLNAGDTYRIVAQEAKVAPYGQETDWQISDKYNAYALPMDQTKEGAVRLDTRVAMNVNGKPLNALRAEGELPENKSMVFRGLEGSDGSEMLLFLHIKNDDKDQKGGQGDSEQEKQEQDQNDQNSSTQDDKTNEDKEQQQQDAKKDGEKSDEEKEQQKMAKANEDKDKSDQQDAQDAQDQNIEALLKSLEEEDQQQQAEARFSRKQFILPRSGEWW